MHDEKEQHAALQSRKDVCVKMTRNARIRERKRIKGGEQGDCQSVDVVSTKKSMFKFGSISKTLLCVDRLETLRH